MADFNVNLSQPQGAGARPVAPVQPVTDTTRNAFVDLASTALGIFVKNRQEKEKQDKENLKNAIISDFVQEQTSLANAAAQGVPTAQIAARSRASFSKYSANYPTLIEEFTKANKSLFEYSELGEVKSDVQFERERDQSLKMEYQKSGGFIPQGASPLLERSILDAYQQTVRIENEFKRSAAVAAERRAQSGEERAFINFEQKENAVKTLVALGSAQLQPAQIFVSDAIAKARGGDISGATQDLNNYFSNLEGAISAAAAATPELAAGWKHMFNELKEAGLKGVDPKTSTEDVENLLKMVKAKIQLTALQTPSVQGAYAASALFGANPAVFQETAQASRDAVMMVTQNVDPLKVPQIVGNKENENVTYKVLDENLALLRSGKAENPTKVSEQVSIGMNNILKQVGRADSAGLTAENLKGVAKFMESPNFAYAVSKNMINQEAAFQAGRVFEVLYERSASKALSTKLDEPFIVSGARQLPIGELVNIQWNGAGVTLIPTQVDPNLDPANPTGTFYRDRLIADLKPATSTINQLIKIGAHREGSTDYSKFWEENKHRILPTYYPDPAKLQVGQIVKGKDGKNYKYIGGNYNDIANSYMEVSNE